MAYMLPNSSFKRSCEHMLCMLIRIHLLLAGHTHKKNLHSFASQQHHADRQCSPRPSSTCSSFFNHNLFSNSQQQNIWTHFGVYSLLHVTVIPLNSSFVVVCSHELNVINMRKDSLAKSLNDCMNDHNFQFITELQRLICNEIHMTIR